MHRIVRHLAVILAIVLLVSFAPARLTTHGEEATPRSGEELPGCTPMEDSPEIEDTVDSQFFAKGNPNEPGGRVIFLYQYTLEPSPEDQPGIPQACYAETVLVYVNQGSEPDALTLVGHEGAIQVRRDAGTASTSVKIVEASPGGKTVTLGPEPLLSLHRSGLLTGQLFRPNHHPHCLSLRPGWSSRRSSDLANLARSHQPFFC